MEPLDEWLEGCLLPSSQWKAFIEGRLSGRPPTERARRAWSKRGTRAWRQRWIDAVRKRVDALGGLILTPVEVAYPRRLLQLQQPPPVLFARGEVRWLAVEDAIAVVGARRASQAALDRARRLGSNLARSGIPVISGLARGVDAAVHEGCLEAGGRPVAVLGTGLDAVYPSGHEELQEEVARQGCVVTEFPPGEGARPWCFVARNRIIAALSRVVVVVEAGRRSGALITVDFAQELGREVAAFPGAVEDESYRGSLQILRDGARLVRDARDVLEELGRFDELPLERAPLGLDRPRRPAEIARLQGMELGRVLAELAQLQLEGRVRRVEGGRYVALESESSGFPACSPPPPDPSV